MAAMICDVCGIEPCQTPGFCEACRQKDAAARSVNGVPIIDFSDFYLHSPQHRYIYLPTGELWTPTSVDNRLPRRDKRKASKWIDQNQAVEQMTWMPGAPTLIKNQLILSGGWVKHEGATVYNHYRPANIELGDAADANPWIEHVFKVYPEDGERIIRWCAHRCQYPHVKINHAIVLGGCPGIGKDTLLAPVRIAVGHWNCRSISPTQLMGRFNGWLKSVLLFISEARDLGEVNRFSFFDHTKDIIAAPPETLLVDEKNTHEFLIPNLCGVVLTTNYKAGGIHLPPDDRRHDVCWSNLTPADFRSDYWTRLWGYYANGGYNNVAAYLWSYDLDGWDCKAPPPKTPAFWEMVNASRSPEMADIADALEKMGYPNVTTIKGVCLSGAAESDLIDWLKEPRNRRSIPRRMEECGYVTVRNPDASDGLWRIEGHRQVAYAKAEMTFSERISAIRRMGQ